MLQPLPVPQPMTCIPVACITKTKRSENEERATRKTIGRPACELSPIWFQNVKNVFPIFCKTERHTVTRDP